MRSVRQFDWHDAKAASNLTKHKLSFENARGVFLDLERIDIDASREQDGEVRRKTIGMLDGKLIAVVYTVRDDVHWLYRRAEPTGQRRAAMAKGRFPLDAVHPPKLTPDERSVLDALTPDEIEQNALDDPDNPPSSDEELARGVVGRRIRLLRQSLGLSQSAFAERYRINIGRLRDIEQGRTMPDSAFLAYITVISLERDAVDRALAS
ncbi:BrnT family toxin [Phreatobacter stygius]|uniref:Helix-turn-helix domain-containing protein n=1 Tax=Phreatobacter stygius TaxID=1940610 RepID=A0A4D7B801_9HYPH|nr:BrnT family toxin [Phreatobacter stygius]QCI66448.1 helix-turn-helix domain-containing protein [Phreatobacter stygius]